MSLIKIFSFLILLYGIIGYVLSLIEHSKDEKDEDGIVIKTIKRKLVLPYHKMAILGGALGFFITLIIVKIGAQDAGVVVTPRGVDDTELHTGWHIVMPWNSVYIMDKTVWVYTCAQSSTEGAKPNADAIWAPTKDGIKMGFDVSVSWRIVATEASWIYANITENDGGTSGRYLWLEENVIRPKLNQLWP